MVSKNPRRRKQPPKDIGRPQTISDDQIVEAVWTCRAQSGACTLGELAKVTGLSTSGLSDRVVRLRESGRLVESDVFGSLRVADERLFRETADGRLIELG